MVAGNVPLLLERVLICLASAALVTFMVSTILIEDRKVNEQELRRKVDGQ